MEPTIVGKVLRECREALGLSPETLAFYSGISAQQIRNIETGRTRKPHQATVDALERALQRAERRQQRKGMA